MGLSFHYKGYIKDVSRIKELTEEVKDICQDMNWKYHILEKTTGNSREKKTSVTNYSPQDLSGISFTPEGCETVFLTFLPNGRICSPSYLMMADAFSDKEMIYTVSTKTQFAGPDVHIAILKLLHYIQKKYLANLSVYDEGHYWNTWDERLLLSQFGRYNFLLDAVTKVLQDLPAVPGETPQSLAERIERLLNEKLKR